MSDRLYKGCATSNCLRKQSTQSSGSASFLNNRSELYRNLRNTNTGVALHEAVGMNGEADYGEADYWGAFYEEELFRNRVTRENNFSTCQSLR